MDARTTGEADGTHTENGSENGAPAGAQAQVEACPVDHTETSNGAAPAGATTAVMSARELPGPRMPAALQVIGYWHRQNAFTQKCRARYGSRFHLSIRVPPLPLYVISTPDDVKQMFTAPPDVLHTGKGSSVIEKFTGQSGLAWLDEDEHLQRRRQLNPTMHGQQLQQIAAWIEETVRQEVASWPRGETREFHPLFHRWTLKVIRNVIFGAEPSPGTDELIQLLTDMMAFNDRLASGMMIHKLPPAAVRALAAIRPLGLGDFLKRRARADELIAEAVEHRIRAGADGDDLVSVLTRIKHDDGSPLSTSEYRDEIMTYFIAGTETTANAIAWAFEYLTRTPEVLERLVDEIDSGDDAYLMATVHEVLRLRPSIPQIIPREVMKPIVIGGVLYEPGMLLWASAYLLHRDPSIYPDPYAFRPERFLDKKPGTYTWIPFGGGRIRCLGASVATYEMKYVLREVLSRYHLRRDDPRPEPTRSRSVGNRPGRGTRMMLVERH